MASTKKPVVRITLIPCYQPHMFRLMQAAAKFGLTLSLPVDAEAGKIVSAVLHPVVPMKKLDYCRRAGDLVTWWAGYRAALSNT